MSTLSGNLSVSKTSKPNHPPTIYGHWLLGTMREFQRDAMETMCRYFYEKGDAVRFRFFLNFYGYVFAHPDHVRHILQDNNRNYTKMPHPTNVILKPVVGNGLLTSEGDFWRRQRRLAQPAFHRRRIAEFTTTMSAAAEAMVRRWQTAASSGQPLYITEEMMELTLEIVGKTLFSLDLTGAADSVGTAFYDASQQLMILNSRPLSPYTVKIPWIPSTRRLNRATAVLDAVVNDIIEQRRQRVGSDGDSSGDDLLGMLMDARDEETGARMDDKQLRDEVMTLMLAGHETTSTALSWTLYLLSQHPEQRERLEEEIDSVLGDRLPALEDLPKLTFANQVLQEAMRIYPPAWAMARWSHEADEVGGYYVAPNSAITLSSFLTHRHPDFWPDAERFDPDRFSPEQEKGRPRFAYIPFGAGPRLCIGNQFAMTEALLILATIVQRYRLDLVPGQQVGIDPQITLRPSGGLPMFIRERHA